jgi:hypothetical protein
MEIVFCFAFRDEGGVERALGILSNIVEYAMGQRLEMIREALPSLSNYSPTSKTITSKTVASQSADPTVAVTTFGF